MNDIILNKVLSEQKIDCFFEQKPKTVRIQLNKVHIYITIFKQK